MSKLTEDETIRLLRETFADREHGVDELPMATTSAGRRRAPMLLAAASVAGVLAGGLYVTDQVRRGDDPGLAQATASPVGPSVAPATSAPATTPTRGQAPAAADILIWAAAAEAGARIERATGSWPVIYVLDAPDAAAAGGGTPRRGAPFDAAARAGIADRLAPLGPVEWVRKRPSTPNVCDQNSKGPYITLGPVVRKSDHVEVGVNVWRGCLDAHWMTYRLDQQGGGWRVTGTVGPVAVS